MDVKELINRPQMYDFEDGVWEFMMGVAFSITGGAFHLVAMQPKGSLAAQNSIWVAQAVWVCSMIAMGWGVRKLKEKFTTPRGGYVAFEDRRTLLRSADSRVLALFIGLPLLVILLVLTPLGNYVDKVSAYLTTAGAYAVFVTGLYVFLGVKYRLVHFFWLAGFSVTVAAWTYTSNGDFWTVFLWQGIALAVAGAIRLWRFVRTHPLPPEIEA